MTPQEIADSLVEVWSEPYTQNLCVSVGEKGKRFVSARFYNPTQASSYATAVKQAIVRGIEMAADIPPAEVQETIKNRGYEFL